MTRVLSAFSDRLFDASVDFVRTYLTAGDGYRLL
jgi:hypothetical protein